MDQIKIVIWFHVCAKLFTLRPSGTKTILFIPCLTGPSLFPYGFFLSPQMLIFSRVIVRIRDT